MQTHSLNQPQLENPLAVRNDKVAPSVESRQLLAGTRELLIRHGDQTYRLCHTRNDKLILVK